MTVGQISKIRALQIFQYLKDSDYDYSRASKRYDLTKLEIFKLVERWEGELTPNRKKNAIKPQKMDVVPIDKTKALEQANAVIMSEYNEDNENKDVIISKIEGVKLETLDKIRELIQTEEHLKEVTNTLKVLHEITLETKLYERENGGITEDTTNKFIQNIEQQLILNVNES